VTPTVDLPAPAVAPVRRRWPGVLLFALIAVTGVVMLRDRLPDPGQVAGILAGADPWWAAGAVVAAVLSQAAFAAQQGRLLGGYGVSVPPARMLALTLSRSAMSMALPAGSAVSAAYAFRVYRRHGATGTVAAVVTAVSAVVSVAALGLLYGAGWLVAEPGTALVVVAGGALLVPLTVVLWRDQRDRVARRGPRFAAAVEGLRDLPGRSWLGALNAGVANWLLDILCLAAAAAACGATPGWGRLALIYLAVQAVRQVPLTPGGVGLIEASMLAGLMASGMPEVTAGAVVLLYRLASCWLMLPLGAAAWFVTRPRH
jgi:uncharacterized membrane protein YbhN (UPF0104 family)